jgi:G3E family GTPase
MEQIPVTVLTGYLGAGKTTLLNRILSAPHGRKYAVIVNEFGEIGIDNDLVVGADEEIFEMNNGCICCTVRGDLIRIISGLIKRARGFDGILIETTGLADPSPVAQTFFADQDVAARTKLDGILTVVDAKHLPLRLKDSKEAAEQIAFADVILLNKTDLIDEKERQNVERLIRGINKFAKIVPTERSAAPLDQILGLGSFDLKRILVHEPDFLATHDKEPGRDHHDHEHDAGIESVSLISDKPINPAKFENWISELRATKGPDLLRYKGILDMAGSDAKLAIQGVHMMMEGSDLAPWQKGEKRQSRLVFIGRNLDRQALAKGFAATHG